MQSTRQCGGTSTAAGTARLPCMCESVTQLPRRVRRWQANGRQAFEQPNTGFITARATASPAPAASLAPAVSQPMQMTTLLPPLTPPVPLPASVSSRNGMYDAQGRVMLKNLTLPELENLMVSMGERPRRARQLYSVLYGTGHWVRDLSETDGDSVIAFSAPFKAKMSAVANVSGGLELESVSTARDGTHKFVFKLKGDEGTATGSVETVLIPMTSRKNRNVRYTACLSTQVGCAMNCQFCFTGRMGLLGNLSSAQVVEQVVMARRWLAEQAAAASQQGGGSTGWEQDSALQQGQGQEQQQEEEDVPQGALSLLASDESHRQQQGVHSSEQQDGTGAVDGLAGEGWWRGTRTARGGVRPFPIGNIVFMGMGEPFHNYDVVMAAIDVLADGLQLSRNKIVVSTVGLADAMRTFLALGKAKLALSLHATTDEVRDWIVPTNRRHPIAELMGLLKEHFPVGARGDRFVLLEYVLLSGVNDSLDDAHRLVCLTRDIYCMINLIIFNPHEGTPFTKSTNEQAQAFRNVLLAAGRVCTLRLSKGDDEMAACGQLGNPGQARRLVPVAAPPPALRDLLAGASAMQAAQAATAADAVS